MKASDLIQILMKDKNIDKDILIVQRKPAFTDRYFRAEEMGIEDVKDFGAIIQLMVDLPEQEECDLEHCDHYDKCLCECEACEKCEGK